MSSKKGKNKVSQADLRKMMQQMKSKKGLTTNGKETAAKRKLPDQVYSVNKTDSFKKTKKDISDMKYATKTAVIQNATNHKPIQTKSILKTGNVETNKRAHVDVDKSNSAIPLKKVKNESSSSIKKPAALVSGFYSGTDESSGDEGPSTSISKPSTIFEKVSENNDAKKSNNESSLPAGFFDDPEVDAKMRGVETPADKMDREWESFQKELQHETGQSEQLIDEEQETGHIDREIDEIDEQMQYYNLIDKLCDKKDEVVNKVKKDSVQDDEIMIVNSSSSEEEDDILDWREKDAFT